ncbi:MAG TPA: homocysteine S-methyltransferase family protein [Casimicrobiaceae bacterium]|nr:homocysteine S-methyltransferase family protein [Casimicrobiaceae bacterium]
MNATATQRPSHSLLERLDQGPVICAEGYLFELERRGYLQAGAFVPEVVLEHPEVVAQLHRDFVHAGSDVVEALTYYAHREKLRIIGRENDLEPINRRALDIAKTVAAESGALFAGDICNTNIYDPADAASHKAVRGMFEEQVAWAVDAGVDFIIGETFSYAQEALIALDVAKRAGQTAVITLAMHQADVTRENWGVVDACKRLADAGADVVGLNCIRGPATMMPLLREIRAVVKTHIAALPVPYRTSEREPSFQSLRDAHWHYDEGARPFPVALDPFTCNRFEIAEFGREALAMDIRYLGVCCGAGPHHIRALAEAVGKRPPASKYSADMSKHAFLGSHERIKKVQKDYASKL